MRRALTTLGLLAAAAATASADWKVTTVTESGSYRSVQTAYYKGKLARSDTDPWVSVADGNRQRAIQWNTATREYVATRWTAPPLREDSKQLVVVRRNGKDTGERQSMFGYTARRFVVTEERYAASKAGAAGQLQSRTTIDGWYIDSSNMPRQLRAKSASYSFLSGHSYAYNRWRWSEPTVEVPRLQVERTGTLPAGLLVSGRTTVQFESGSSVSTEQVIELSEAPLPDELFRPPSDYRRVISFSNALEPALSTRVRRSWEMFEDWVSGLFS